MKMNPLVALAQKVAKENNLDPALVCAIVEQESSWQQNAIRFEPAFYKAYIERHYGPMEHLPSGSKVIYLTFSYGLMQVMGQTAREQGYTEDLVDLLINPEDALQMGCKVLQSKLKRANGNVENALLFWNGGSNKQYPSQVMARMKKYQTEENNEFTTETKS